MTPRWAAGLTLLGLLAPLSLSGCDDGKAEHLGREVDDALKDVKDSVDRSLHRDGPAERAGEKVDRAGERLEDRFQRDPETIDTSHHERGPAERAGETLDDAGHRLGRDVRDAFDHDGPAERAGERVDEATDRR